MAFYRWLAGLTFFRKLAFIFVVGSVFVFGRGVLEVGRFDSVTSKFSINGQKIADLTERVPSTTNKPQVLGVALAPEQLVFRVETVFDQDITAKSIYADLLELQQDLTVGGDAAIDGDTTLSGDMTLAGNATLGGDAIVGGTLSVTGLTSLKSELTLGGDVTGEGITIDVGDGEVLASNLVYSLQGEVGELELEAGTGISISGLTITNDDGGSDQSIFKQIAVSGQSTLAADGNDDTLTFVGGTGLSITTDAGADKLTFTVSSSDLNISGWGDGGTTVALTTSSDNVGIGTTTATSKLHVVGDALIDGDLSVTGNTTVLSGFNNSGGGITNAGAITGATGLTSSGTITFSGLSTGVVQSSFAGALSSSALNLAGGASYITGALPATNGGTGVSTYVTGDILYASGTNTLTKLGVGGDGEVLTVASGIPDWASPSSGSPCATCIITNPGSTQTITPTAATAIGLSIRQASAGSVDIFNVTSNDGVTKYLRVDSSGNVQLGSSGTTTTGNFTVSPTNTDPIAIAPVAMGSNAFTGTITSADLTATRTWTLPDATGTFCLTTGNCVGSSAGIGGSGTTNYITKWSSTYGITDSLMYDDGTNIGIGTTVPTTKLHVVGTGNITGATSIGGALTASSTFHAVGATDLDSTLNVDGDADLNATLGVTGATTLSSTLDVTGLTTLGGNLSVNGAGNSYFTGNVGIGTTVPAAKLDVRGDIFTDQYLVSSTNTFLGISVASDGTLSHTSGQEGWYNTAIGSLALQSLTTGNKNSALGYGAGINLTTGASNVFIGMSTASTITTGSNNIAIGENALGNAGIGAVGNVALGASAIRYVSGNYSVGVGHFAGLYNTTATNTYVGGLAGQGTSSYSASGLTFVGYQAGYNIATNGNNNTFIGYQAGDSVTSGSNNLLIGYGVDTSSATATYELNIGNTLYGNLSTGNVGIGTTSPLGKLNIEGAATGKALAILNETGNQAIFVASASGTNRFIIQSDGNVGIGSTSPGYAIDVAGEFNLTDAIRSAGDAGSSGYLLTSSGGGAMTWTAPSALGDGASIWTNTSNVYHPTNEYASVADLAIGGNSTASAQIQLKANGQAYFAGNVGIGSTSPGYKLDIAGDTNLSSGSVLKVGGTTVLNLSSTAIASMFLGDGGVSHGANDDYNQSFGIGALASLNNTTGLRNLALGYNSLTLNTSGDDNIAIGYLALSSSTTGTDNIAIGTRALDAAGAGQGQNIAIGTDALGTTSTISNYNIAIGYGALDVHTHGISNSGNNTAIGTNAGGTLIGGMSNTFIGSAAGLSSTTGSYNVYIGERAGRSGTNTGSTNVVIGSDTGSGNLTGSNNVILGTTVGNSLTSAEENVLIGQAAGSGITTGDRNVAIGRETFQGSAGAGTDNVLLGFRTGEALGGSSAQNTLLGAQAGLLLGTSSSRNIMIGYNAGAQDSTGSDLLYIDPTNTTAPLIYGDFSSDLLGINGQLGVGTQAPTSKFEVTGAQKGKALTILNETGNQNILAASASGVTVATLSNTGGLAIDGQLSDLNDSTLTVNDDLRVLGAISVTGSAGFDGNVTLGNATNDDLAFTGRVASDIIPKTDNAYDLGSSSLQFADIRGTALYQNGNLVCDSSGANCNNYWRLASGAVSPVNNTLDVLLGSNASASAKFAFLNMNTGTPTASISANSGNNAATFTGTGILGTTNRQTLTLGSSSGGNLSLVSGGATAATILSDGSVGLGTTAPISRLNLVDGEIRIGTNGSCNNDFCLDTGGIQTFFDYTITNHNGGDFIMMPDGYVGIGTTNPGVSLDVETDDASNYVGSFFNDGNSANRWGVLVQAGLDDQTAAGPSTLMQFNDGNGGAIGSITFGSSLTAYNTTSDQRAKENIVDSSIGIDQLMNIKIRDFSFIADQTGKRHTGYIAQELYQVFPDAVTPFSDGRYWQVDYGKVTPLIIKAVQDQQLQLQSLTSQTLALSTDGLLTDALAENQVLGASIEATTQSLSALQQLVAVISTSADALQSTITALIERIANIEIGVAKLQSVFEIVGDKLTVDQDTTFGKRVLFEDKDAAGLAIVSSGATSQRVEFEHAYAQRPIISLTPESALEGYYITDVSEYGFTIVLRTALDHEVTFNWSATAVKDARVTRSGAPPSSSPMPNTSPSPSSEPEDNPEATPSPEPSPSPDSSPSPQGSPEATASPEPTVQPEASPAP